MNSTFNIQHSKLNVFFWIVYSCLHLAACGQASNKATKFQQYFVQGEQLYLKSCSNCHQKKGDGLGRLYPPLNNSDYMDQHLEDVICIMKNGVKGELLVNGKKYNKEMKGIPSLTELEIAEIATYIYNSWGRQRGLIDIQTVAKALEKCPQ
ncbi:MAG: cytochrome c [Cytophagales bacterium]|nr:cytochrome c [Cytophagales bacterium]MCA6389320.1 cytochrome c [Cytophagales bacterium]MCA6392775.1 cytochrome c [Cytophagales bacterium]MCA6394748.1 cytochrome c [Cytophagales bacterium]MCA6398091.1 cytochrome c [Cytophagales bacterium]